MKGVIIILFMLAGFGLLAQTPQAFKFQAAIRDNNGNILANKLVSIKLSLISSSTNGNLIYSEIHNLTTTDFGIANINVGSGTPVAGLFSNIDWGNGPHFLKTELDINNGTNFLFMGTTQLLSVPYALYAGKAANAEDDKDKDSLNEIQQIGLNGNQLQLSKSGGLVNLDKYNDNTDSQTISLQGNILSISRGNSILLSGAVDLDSDPTNELQVLYKNKDTLHLSKSNYVLFPKDNDGDSLNEIQNLSLNGNRLFLSKANQVNIDTDTINEIQTLSQSGNTISLNKGGGNVQAVTPTNIQNGSLLFASSVGVNNLQLSLTPAATQYSIGMLINFSPLINNTGHVTINLNNLGNKPLFKNLSDTLIKGDLIVGKIYSIIFDGLRFQLLNGTNSPKNGISNPFIPGKIGRSIFLIPSPSTDIDTIQIPLDTIAISCGGNFLQMLLSDSISTNTVNLYNFRNSNPTGINNVHIFPSGSYITYTEWANLIFLKAEVLPICITAQSPPYTFIVPNNQFFCINYYYGISYTKFKVNGSIISSNDFLIPLILPPGSIISFSGPSISAESYLMGYLFTKQ